MRVILIIAIALMLQGCLFNILKPQSDNVTIHPDLPRPVQGIQIDWKLVDYEGEYVIVVDYEDYLNLLDFQNDTGRYIKQINKTVCYYREELEEEFCKINSGELK